MSRLNETDLELLHTGQDIDLSDPKGRWAYLGGNFTENPNDYVEVLIYDTNENFLESAIVDSGDYIYSVGEGIKLKTGTILRKMGYDRGRYVVKYNFLRKVAGSYENILVDGDNNRHTDPFDPNSAEDRARIGNDLFIKEYKYFIHEISPTRQEVRLVSDIIKEEGNNHRYLRSFYDMQRTKKRIASLGDEDTALEFVSTTDGTNKGNSYELKFKDSTNTFSNKMVGGTVFLNKAFVTQIVTPEDPESWGAGTPPEEPYENQSEALRARFAITNVDSAEIKTTGDFALSRGFEAFKGLNMDSSTGAIADLTYDKTPNILKNIRDLVEAYYQFTVFTNSGVEGDNFQLIELVSISERPLNSPATYTWEVFGFDRDTIWKRNIFNQKYADGYSWDPARVKTSGNDGDFVIRGGGINGSSQTSSTFTDSNKTDGSKIAIEMHSKNVHLGVRLHITNDLGQEDEIVIPAFLTTRD